MSWVSTVEYYGLISRGVAARTGGRHSAKLLMHSLDFAEIPALGGRRESDAGGAVAAESGGGHRDLLPARVARRWDAWVAAAGGRSPG